MWDEAVLGCYSTLVWVCGVIGYTVLILLAVIAVKVVFTLGEWHSSRSRGTAAKLDSSLVFALRF